MGKPLYTKAWIPLRMGLWRPGGLLSETVGSKAAEVASAELLVNLTPHDVALTSREPDGSAGHADGASLVRVPRSGSFARVDDEAATVGAGLLATRAGVFRLTSLRRDGQLVDLPGPRPGTRFLVSRLTALAARDRADLVFPLGEIRDDDGQVAGALGLGAFAPDSAEGHRLSQRSPREAGLASRPTDRQWLVSALFAVALLLLGAAVGTLPSALDEGSGSHGSWSTWSLWLTVGFGIAGLLVLAVATWRWARVRRIRRLRGTAYVIVEETRDWRMENKAAKLAEIDNNFDRMLEILGPQGLGFKWNWEADWHSAPQWDGRADQLVNSFMAVQKNDAPDTLNSLFIWAPWPVAMAFGARVSARDRNLPLHVRQRDSHAPVSARPRITDVAHDFQDSAGVPSLESIAPALAVICSDAKVSVTVKPLGPPGLTHKKRGRAESQPASVRDDPFSLLLLVVRITPAPVGPVGMDLATTEPFELEVTPRLTGHLLRVGPQEISVAEWRLTVRDAAGTQAAVELPWAAFPSAAAEISRWVAEQAAAHQARVVLLASRMPQELGVGLGVQLQQRSWDLATGPRWPEHVYPAIYAGDNRRLIVPDLPLGADSVPNRRV